MCPEWNSTDKLKTKTHTVFFWLSTTQTDVKIKDKAENIEEIQWAVLNGDPGDD